MKVVKNESSSSSGKSYGETTIGFFGGELLACNPTAEQIQKLYELEETPEDPVCQGVDKNGNDWAMVKFLFKNDIDKKIIPYTVFLKKEYSEWDKKEEDGSETHKIEFINQFGQTQIVSDKKDLWESFMFLHQWDKDAKKFVPILENGEKMSISYRKAWNGEGELYALLAQLFPRDVFKPTLDHTLFIKIDDLMKGKVTEITSQIGGESIKDVVGMAEVKKNEKDGNVFYSTNCIPRAWMQADKYSQANGYTQNQNWDYLDSEEAKSNKKTFDLRGFRYNCKRSKNIVEYVPLHVFDPAASNSIVTTDATMKVVETSKVDDTKY